MRENIDALLETYLNLLKEMEEVGTKFTDGQPDAIDKGIFAQITHLKGMIAKMLAMDDFIKLNRWLGFMQGALWLMQVRTIDELSDETRGAVAEELRAAPANTDANKVH